MSKPHHKLYFIANRRRSHVKIGISRDPDRRLYDLQAGNHDRLQLDLVLNFETPTGAKVYEDACHQHFAKHWLHREWFRYGLEIKAFVDHWNAGACPEIPMPERTCASFVDEYGAGLPKEELMALLRRRARGK